MGLAIAGLWLSGVGPMGVAGAATPAVPYSDPRATGVIGLCNEQGQQITSGSIKSTPFIPRAVSTTPAESSVSGSGRTATLYAFQPVKGEDPSYWSGQALTGASVYSDASAPTTVSTNRDLPLSNFLAIFPPTWDGFIQLRIYLGAPNQSPYVASYPTLNLYVSGDTWLAVGGGSVNCNSGQAISKETLLGVPGAVTANTSGTVSSSAPSSSTTTTTQPRLGAVSPGSGSVQTSATGAEGDAAADLPSHASRPVGPVIGVVVAAGLVIGLGTVLVIRRRKRVAK